MGRGRWDLVENNYNLKTWSIHSLLEFIKECEDKLLDDLTIEYTNAIDELHNRIDGFDTDLMQDIYLKKHYLESCHNPTISNTLSYMNGCKALCDIMCD